MAYDEHLANRVRELLSAEHADEKAMFGGLAFLINGNMSVAVSSKGGLMVRVPSEQTATLLERAHVTPMVMGGRDIRGWILVDDEGMRTKAQLSKWVARGVDHAKSLPAK